MQALIDFLISIWENLIPWYIVEPWEEGVRVRLGRWIKVVGPGPVLTLPFVDQVHTLDVKRQCVDAADVSMETLDPVTVFASVTITYRITNVRKALIDVQDHDDSLITDVSRLVGEWVNQQNYEDVTVPHLVEALYPKVRDIGFRWGCEVEVLGVNNLTKHRVYRLLTE